jgi:hypothetical protein
MLPFQDINEGNILMQWGLFVKIKRDPVSKMLCIEQTEESG